MNLKVPSSSLRKPGWSKAAFLRELQTFRDIKTLCIHFGGEEHWRGYYGDYWRWQHQQSPDFDPQFKAAMDDWKANHSTRQHSGGRKRVTEDSAWKEEFRRAIVKYNGNRYKAAEGMPYALDTILKMMNENNVEFDKELHEKVGLAYFELGSKAEEATFNALDDLTKNPNPDQAKVSQATGWLATKILEKVDRTRWGRETTVNVKGKIQHELVPSATVIARLSAQQQRFFGEGVLRTLPAAPVDLPETLDAEYVETENE